MPEFFSVTLPVSEHELGTCNLWHGITILILKVGWWEGYSACKTCCTNSKCLFYG